MMAIDDSGLWPAHQAGPAPSSNGSCDRLDELADVSRLSFPDLATIDDAFDTDESEPQPEYGDFWQPREEEEF